MKRLVTCVLLVALAAAVGCGKDAVSESNKNLKPIDPNAPKPSAAGAGGGASGAGKGGPRAGAEVVK